MVLQSRGRTFLAPKSRATRIGVFVLCGLLFGVFEAGAYAQSVNVAGIGTIAALRSLTTSPGPAYVQVANYGATGSGGGGLFYLSSSPCAEGSAGTASWEQGSRLVTATGTISNVNAGMTVVTPGLTGLMAGDTVVSASGSSILLTSPATQSSGTSTLNFSSDNGGSIICDSEATPQIYIRATYSHSPKDWGALGGGVIGGNDDTVPLQNWIDAVQPHIGDTDTYMVNAPLVCPTQTVTIGAQT